MKQNIILDKTFAFALKIIELYKLLNFQNEYVISRQLLKCGTSIGSNAEEAVAAQSKKDFISKYSISAKEARETHYWLRLLKQSGIIEFDYDAYLSDCEEIIRILTAIIKTSQQTIVKKEV